MGNKMVVPRRATLRLAKCVVVCWISLSLASAAAFCPDVKTRYGCAHKGLGGRGTEFSASLESRALPLRLSLSLGTEDVFEKWAAAFCNTYG